MDSQGARRIVPPEIVYKILEFQFFQLMENTTSPISKNTQFFIRSNLSVNKVFYRCVLKLIYKYCCFQTPHTFDSFLRSVQNRPQLGELVKVLDFQEFTSIGLGRTGKMNKEIQMVTSDTILDCLRRCPNVVEFLASENIKDDLNLELLSYLFNEMRCLRAVDFCGCSGEIFTSQFDLLQVHWNESITDVSFHDCTDLPSFVLEKVIVQLPNLKKLDLTHTQITSKILQLIPKSSKLTHLNLSYCIQLTTRELISFFINHDCISDQLVWLSLQCDNSTNSTLSNNQLTFLLKMFDCDFQYLNLGGLKVSMDNLQFIKKKFINLQSLVLANNEFTQYQIMEFLKPLPNVEYQQQIKFIDLSNNNDITRWSLDNPKFISCSPSLQAFEFNMKIINEIEAIGGKLVVHSIESTYSLCSGKAIWKTYDSGGRRGWLFHVNEANPDNTRQIGIIEYDIETGEKMFKIHKLPEFLRYVNKKIAMSKGVLGVADEVFGDLERGIYKYYGMKM